MTNAESCEPRLKGNHNPVRKKSTRTTKIPEIVTHLQLTLAVKHLDCLVNQYGGKLTEVAIGKRTRQQHPSNGPIQDDTAAPEKARMASQVKYKTYRDRLKSRYVVS